jgi:hypothetical protein
LGVPAAKFIPLRKGKIRTAAVRLFTAPDGYRFVLRRKRQRKTGFLFPSLTRKIVAI